MRAVIAVAYNGRSMRKAVTEEFKEGTPRDVGGEGEEMGIYNGGRTR